MEGINVAHDAALVVLSAVLSCAGTIAVFSARLLVMATQHTALATQVERDRTADKELLVQRFNSLCEQLERQERLQRAVLEVVANIARSGGEGRRAHSDDALVRFLSEDAK